MIIENFRLRKILDFNWKETGLNNKVCVFFSKENSTGKTTIMRAILYTLGFAVPNTELIKFEEYEFALNIIRNGQRYNVYRKKNLLILNETEFDLPVDEIAAHAFLFGIKNVELINNLLGTIYFDQEKGWTLLNRGTIIGKNRFSIESFFRGLKEDESQESYEIVEKIRALDKKIEQYKLLLNVAEYQAAINQSIDSKLDFQSYDQELEADLAEKKMQLSKTERELARVNDIISANNNFANYIEKKKIFIKNPIDGSAILVSKDTLLEYQDVTEINIARQSMLIANRNTLKRQIAQIESQQEKQIAFTEIPALDEELTRRLADIKGISAIQVTSILNDMKKQKKELTNLLDYRAKSDNPWVANAYKLIEKYAKELQIPFDYKIDIFTRNLKEKSGAILHKMVFAHKMAYIELLSKKIGYPLPIFCDSPSGREVEKSTVDDIMKILFRDFSKHQIFIASIYKYDEVFADELVIKMDGTLFNNQTVFER